MTKAVQPAHVDAILQAMIDQSSRQGAETTSQPSHISAQSTSSYASSFPSAAPYPDISEDVNMESSADKRSRESPDSTLKPEGKSLKTSGPATASSTRHIASSSCATDNITPNVNEEQETTSKASTVRWKANDAPQARLLVRQMHRRIPAWKLKLCVEALNARPIDLVRIAEVIEIQFATEELFDVATQCLTEIAKEMESTDSSVGATGAAAAAPNQSEKEAIEAGPAPSETNEETETTDEEPSSQAGKDDSHKQAGDQGATAPDSSKPTSPAAAPSQGATASHEESTSKHADASSKESSQDWITRFLKGGHDLLWPTGLASSACPTLLTGLKMDNSDHLIDNLMDWERKFESANLEKHKQFLQEAQLLVYDNPLEATAWENGS